MPAAALVAFVLSVLVPVAVLVGLSFWVRRIWERTAIPRWLGVVSIVLVSLVALTDLGILFIVGASVLAIAGQTMSAADNARALAAGISEAINSAAFAILISLFAAAWMLLLTWRYRRSWPDNASNPPGGA
jgi:hypothetical protein